MEEQALAIGHVGIDFQPPAGSAEGGLEPGSESGKQRALHPPAARPHETFQTLLALPLAWSVFRDISAAEAEGFLVHDKVDVLREPLDKPPCLGERSAALESEVLAESWQGEKLPQGPANPEILFDADRLQAHLRLDLLEGEAALGGWQGEEGVHGSGQGAGSVRGRSRSAIQAGA